VKIVEILHNRSNIEQVVSDYNKHHYKKVLVSPVYNDKIIRTLKEGKVREKTLNGTLEHDDCNTQELYDFLCLLNKG